MVIRKVILLFVLKDVSGSTFSRLEKLKGEQQILEQVLSDFTHLLSPPEIYPQLSSEFLPFRPLSPSVSLLSPLYIISPLCRLKSFLSLDPLFLSLCLLSPTLAFAFTEIPEYTLSNDKKAFYKTIHTPFNHPALPFLPSFHISQPKNPDRSKITPYLLSDTSLISVAETRSNYVLDLYYFFWQRYFLSLTESMNVALLQFSNFQNPTQIETLMATLHNLCSSLLSFLPHYSHFLTRLAHIHRPFSHLEIPPYSLFTDYCNNISHTLHSMFPWAIPKSSLTLLNQSALQDALSKTGNLQSLVLFSHHWERLFSTLDTQYKQFIEASNGNFVEKRVPVVKGLNGLFEMMHLTLLAVSSIEGMSEACVENLQRLAVKYNYFLLSVNRDKGRRGEERGEFPWDAREFYASLGGVLLAMKKSLIELKEVVRWGENEIGEALEAIFNLQKKSEIPAKVDDFVWRVGENYLTWYDLINPVKLIYRVAQHVRSYWMERGEKAPVLIMEKEEKGKKGGGKSQKQETNVNAKVTQGKMLIEDISERVVKMAGKSVTKKDEATANNASETQEGRVDEDANEVKTKRGRPKKQLQESEASESQNTKQKTERHKREARRGTLVHYWLGVSDKEYADEVNFWDLVNEGKRITKQGTMGLILTQREVQLSAIDRLLTETGDMDDLSRYLFNNLMKSVKETAAENEKSKTPINYSSFSANYSPYLQVNFLHKLMTTLMVLATNALDQNAHFLHLSSGQLLTPSNDTPLLISHYAFLHANAFQDLLNVPNISHSYFAQLRMMRRPLPPISSIIPRP